MLKVASRSGRTFGQRAREVKPEPMKSMSAAHISPLRNSIILAEIMLHLRPIVFRGVLLLVLLVLHSPASAAPVRFEFSGVLTVGFEETTNYFDRAWAFGSPFFGSLSYDPARAALDEYQSPDRLLYQFSAGPSLEIAIGSDHFEAIMPGLMLLRRTDLGFQSATTLYWEFQDEFDSASESTRFNGDSVPGAPGAFRLFVEIGTPLQPIALTNVESILSRFTEGTIGFVALDARGNGIYSMYGEILNIRQFRSPIALPQVLNAIVFSSNAAPAIVAPFNAHEVTVVLDASGSGDPDGDVLNYSWKLSDGATFGRDIRATNSFRLGIHVVSLEASDDSFAACSPVVFQVVSPQEATAQLAAFLDNTTGFKKRSLHALLNRAERALRRNHPNVARRVLTTFERRTDARIAGTNPDLGRVIVQGTQAILHQLL
jgi:hypothetical protein